MTKRILTISLLLTSCSYISGPEGLFPPTKDKFLEEKVEENIKLLQQLENINIIGTCTTSMLNITRFVDICKYFESLGVWYHTSLVQYPNELNIKNLPILLKEKVTKEWYEYKDTLTDSKNHKKNKN